MTCNDLLKPGEDWPELESHSNQNNSPSKTKPSHPFCTRPRLGMYTRPMMTFVGGSQDAKTRFVKCFRRHIRVDIHFRQTLNFANPPIIKKDTGYPGYPRYQFTDNLQFKRGRCQIQEEYLC